MFVSLRQNWFYKGELLKAKNGPVEIDDDDVELLPDDATIVDGSKSVKAKFEAEKKKRQERRATKLPPGMLAVEKRLVAIEGRIDELEPEGLDDLKKDVTTLRDDLNDLVARVEKLEKPAEENKAPPEKSGDKGVNL